MNTSSHSDNLNLSDPANERGTGAPIFDPFPEPRTYPSGWDLSSLPAVNPAANLAQSA